MILALTYDLDLQSTVMVMTYLCAKVQGLQSVISKDRVETNGQMVGGDCITSVANEVSKRLVNMKEMFITCM